MSQASRLFTVTHIGNTDSEWENTQGRSNTHITQQGRVDTYTSYTGYYYYYFTNTQASTHITQTTRKKEDTSTLQDLTQLNINTLTTFTQHSGITTSHTHTCRSMIPSLHATVRYSSQRCEPINESLNCLMKMYFICIEHSILFRNGVFLNHG